MKKKTLFLLFIISLGVALLAAWFERVPGYMDAEYYFNGAVQMASGFGWREMFVWNYLDNPAGLPHVGYVYWMPLASILAVPGMVLFNSTSFTAGRLLPLILAALIPPVTASLSYKVFKRNDFALLSAGLALFPGFYLIYNTNIETFTPFMLLGALFLWVGFNNENKPSVKDSILIGFICGFMHLARSDGLLWLVAACLLISVRIWGNKGDGRGRYPSLLRHTGLIILVYGCVMSIWYLRNLSEFNSLFPLGNSRVLWLTSYNQLFVYPAEMLNVQNWLDSGWINILSSRWSAGLDNLKTLLGVQGLVFLLPLIIIGIIQNRQRMIVRFGVAMWLTLFLVMSLVFPFAGARGGFFHSGSSIQVFLWVMAPPGLETFIRWMARRRSWNIPQANRVFSLGLVMISMVVSGYLYWYLVIGGNINQPVWENDSRQAQEIETWLVNHQIKPSEAIFINNPPGYYSATGRPAYVIPDVGPQRLLDAARQYQVDYLVLEKSHVEGMNDLYLHPESQPAFRYMGSIHETLIFEMTP